MKKKEKIIKIIALFMINLVMFIPISFAQLTNPKVYGEDLVEGYARKNNDSLTFTVNAKLDNKTIEAEEVRLWGNSYDTGFGFTGCELAEDDYYCALEGFSAYENHVDICPMYINKINLYEDTILQDSVETKIVCDNTKPIINKFVADKTTYTEEDDVNLSFTITDKADITDARYCIGILGAVLDVNDYSETIEIYTQPGECSYSGEFGLEAGSIGEGNNKARLTVYDNFGNSAYKEISFGKDVNSPEIDNLVITDTNNDEIVDWIDGSVAAYVYVDIYDDNYIDMNSITADLSDLGGSDNAKPNSCTKRINGTRCKWSVQIELEESKSAKLIFEAKDTSGNMGIQGFTYSFNVDNTGPVADGIKTNFVYGGVYYALETGNAFAVSFTEEAGLDEAYLDLSSLSGGVVKSDSCENNVCLWEDVASGARDGMYTISVSSKTEDKLGNKLENNLELEVKVDIKAPVVKSVEVIPVAGSNPLIDDFIQTGNGLLIKVTVYEPDGLTASADLSKFIQGAEDIPGQCTQETNIWVCEWQTSEIDVAGYIVNYIRFNFTDVIGNVELYDHSLIVFAAEDEAKDYWRNVVGDSSPEGIDKEIIALYDPLIWFPVDLYPNDESNIWPLSVEVGSCLNAEGESYAAYISSAFGNMPEMFNYNTEEKGDMPYKLYLRYTLERAEPPDGGDELTITCSLKIRTLVKGKRISMVEDENITVVIPYYYNPLGTLDGNIEDEIGRAKESWLVKQKWIETINTVLKYAKLACRITDMYKDFTIILGNIKDILAASCVVNPVVCADSKKIGEGQEMQKQTLRKLYDQHAFKWCKLMSCQLWEKEWGYKSGDKGMERKEGGIMAKLSRESWLLQSETYSRRGYLGNVDPQHSLVLSALFLCLPGVFYNLQKARLIDCQYIICLEQTAYGMPVQMCTSQRAYGYCKFVYGEFFNLIPFAAAISRLAQNVKKALSHPAEGIGFALSVLCRTTCKSPVPVGSCKICTFMDTFSLGLELLCDLGLGKGCEPIWDQFKVDDSICKTVLEEDEESGEEDEPVVA